MAEPLPPAGPVPPRLELRLEGGWVRVGLGPASIGEGIELLDLELEPTVLPGPFDPGAGTAPFRAVPCTLRRLVVATAGDPPGPEALAELLAAALTPSGWPLPDTGGLVHRTWNDRDARGAAWRRPADHAREGLAEAGRLARAGAPDAPLRLALAGHAALAAGLAAEGAGALRQALATGLGRDDAREAWGALLASARGAADPTAEREALAGLAAAAPTGERPALLLQLARLDRAAGDGAAARTHAEEARKLAPRDPEAVLACLSEAQAADDGPAVVDLLERLAVLEPARAGERLLERARRLVGLGRAADADAGYTDALARLPPDRALADEQVALRRSLPPTGAPGWSEPLETFAARCGPAEAAVAFRDAALLAREQGDHGAALRAARRAHALAHDPAFAGELLAELLHAGGSVQEALDLHRSLLGPGGPALDPEPLADRLHALADLAEEAGDRDAALEALDRLLALRPYDAAAAAWRFRLDPDRERATERLRAVIDEVRSPSRRDALLELARPPSPPAPPSPPDVAEDDPVAPALASARALEAAGELGSARARLELAAEFDPGHPALVAELARIEGTIAALEASLAEDEARAEAEAAHDPAGAAERYRALAEIARTRLDDAGRAVALLAKGAALVPGDPATTAALASLRAVRRAPLLASLAADLAALRLHPTDRAAAGRVAAAARELAPSEPGAWERSARETLAATASALATRPTGPTSPGAEARAAEDKPVPVASLPAEVRHGVAVAPADGPTARLLALLAPYLEPLFPVALARHGVGPADLLPAGCTPDLYGAFEEARRALDGRPVALLSAPGPGLVLGIENTRPPAVVLGRDVAALGPSAAAFLAARSVALATAGFALLGRFAPRDVAILCELASRFAGGEPPALGLPAARAGDFLSALERTVPAPVRERAAELGPASAAELATLAPEGLVTALEATADRLALLHAGDLGAALAVLTTAGGDDGTADPLSRAAAIELARFALSDSALGLRGMLRGWT